MHRWNGLRVRYAYPWNLGPLVPPSGQLQGDTANAGTFPPDIGDDLIYGRYQPPQPESDEDE